MTDTTPLRSVQQVARASGTTSRTLRHYDRIGLLPPTEFGANGYRYYDDRALVRLQRILLLRELGLGLEAIARVLAMQDEQARGHPAPTAEAEILQTHLAILHRERDRLQAQIGAVERTITALRRPHVDPTNPTTGDLMTHRMFDGFDHSQHREEVEQRWGADAYAAGDRWWSGLGDDERSNWQERSAQLAVAWTAAADRGTDPTSGEAQELAARHIAWLRSIPGTPAADPNGDVSGYIRGLAELYVADDRFAANYGGMQGAAFVRDALLHAVDAAESA
ncbi:MerR family transcriptional regulator [Leucobacter japonicus]|uniref:MerR family transcriptional regulator n=1 Tax=Leucobacter japonicus TaxID=1461259 RepID=UPI0006A7E0D1|nr:MerR family transcriptional regulator [Leucobacter japonicus]